MTTTRNINKNLEELTAYDRALQEKLEALELKYSFDKIGVDGATSYSLGFQHSGRPSVDVHIRNSNEGDMKLINLMAVHIPQSKRLSMINKLNELNFVYKYAKFFLDDDNDIIVTYDLTFAPEDKEDAAKYLAEQTVLMMMIFVHVLEDATPKIMQLLWSEDEPEEEENPRKLTKKPLFRNPFSEDDEEE